MSVIEFFTNYWDWWLLIGAFVLAAAHVERGVTGRDNHPSFHVILASILVWVLWPVFCLYIWMDKKQ